MLRTARKACQGQQRFTFGPFRQPALTLVMGPDPGRRGEPDAYWLDAVLLAFRGASMSAPSLADLQAAWDAKLSSLEVLQRAMEGRISSTFTGELPESVALARLNHKPPVASWTGPLALPKPLDAYSRAHALVGKGLSQRAAAKLMGMPITTFRRLIGRVD